MSNVIVTVILLLSLATLCVSASDDTDNFHNGTLSGKNVCSKRIVYQGTAIETFLVKKTVLKRCRIGSLIELLKKKCRKRYYTIIVTSIGTRIVKRTRTKVIKYCCYGYQEIKGKCVRDIKVIVLWITIPVVSLIIMTTAVCLCWCFCCKKKESHVDDSKCMKKPKGPTKHLWMC